MRLLYIGVLILAACQDDITTPFPPGLEPLEDNEVPDTDSTDEVLRKQSVDGHHTAVHGRGYVHADMRTLWELSKDPAVMVARCSTTSYSVMLDNEPEYETSYLVHYYVDNIVDVEWDDQWRYGIVTVDDMDLGVVRHQKIAGSDFIDLSEGTIQLIDAGPGLTEVAFVEHLEAVMGSAEDLGAGMQDNFDALVAVAHGLPIPACFRAPSFQTRSSRATRSR